MTESFWIKLFENIYHEFFHELDRVPHNDFVVGTLSLVGIQVGATNRPAKVTGEEILNPVVNIIKLFLRKSRFSLKLKQENAI